MNKNCVWTIVKEWVLQCALPPLPHLSTQSLVPLEGCAGKQLLNPLPLIIAVQIQQNFLERFYLLSKTWSFQTYVRCFVLSMFETELNHTPGFAYSAQVPKCSCSFLLIICVVNLMFFFTSSILPAQCTVMHSSTRLASSILKQSFCFLFSFRWRYQQSDGWQDFI